MSRNETITVEELSKEDREDLRSRLDVAYSYVLKDPVSGQSFLLTDADCRSILSSLIPQFEREVKILVGIPTGKQ